MKKDFWNIFIIFSISIYFLFFFLSILSLFDISINGVIPLTICFFLIHILLLIIVHLSKNKRIKVSLKIVSIILLFIFLILVLFPSTYCSNSPDFAAMDDNSYSKCDCFGIKRVFMNGWETKCLGIRTHCYINNRSDIRYNYEEVLCD